MNVDTVQQIERGLCENSYMYKGNLRTCGDLYNCCSCGDSCGDSGCGCRYCFDCNACDHCKKDD